jgi:aryl-alcohol dehydrogenase-like predicted oxidoreductase
MFYTFLVEQGFLWPIAMNNTRRLNTTYIEFLQIDRFDTTTPLEETIRTLHELIQSGKVRYISASSMLATQFARLQFCAEKNNWTKSPCRTSITSSTARKSAR